MNIKKQEFKFEVFTKTEKQIDLLFNLLKNRAHFISFQSISYEEHRKFASQHPYRAWYLVEYNKNYLGSFYITKENTIGINVDEEITQIVISEIIKFINDNYAPLPAIKSIRANRFSVNVPPSNSILAQTLEEIGATVAQVSYYLPKD